MQRDRNNTVTSKKKTLPVLVASSPEAQEGVATFQQELGAPQPVRTFRNEDLKNIKKHLSESEAQHFCAVIALKEAMKTRTDTIALEKAMNSLRKAYELRQAESQLDSYPDEVAQGFAKLIGLPPQEALKHLQFLRPGPRASKDPGWLLSYELSRELWEVQFVLWWTDQTFRPALWCPNMKTAFYARALLDVIGGKGIRICPHCGDLFPQDRPDQNYCSVAHREAHRVARWRLHQKQKATGKKEKNVTRKAR